MEFAFECVVGKVITVTFRCDRWTVTVLVISQIFFASSLFIFGIEMVIVYQIQGSSVPRKSKFSIIIHIYRLKRESVYCDTVI